VGTSAELKAELSLLMPARSCCQWNELRALTLALRGRPDRGGLAIRTPLNRVARKLVRLAREIGIAQTEFHKGRTLRRPSYTVRLAPEAPVGVGLQSASAPERPCCRRAFLRGAFLGAGTLVAPARGYHLEFALPASASADAVSSALTAFEVIPGRYRRRGRFVVYVKEAEQIARSLTALGASRAVMEFESFRVVQEMRAQVNRRTNTETANMSKSMRAAVEQTAWVRLLQAAGRLERLPEALRSAAALRLAHPRATLQELAGQAGVSKSAMNGRLRRLRQWAEGREPAE